MVALWDWTSEPLTHAACIEQWEKGCEAAVEYMHKNEYVHDLRMDDLDLFCEDKHEGLYERITNTVLTPEQWERVRENICAGTHEEGGEEYEKTWPVLRIGLVLVSGGIEARRAAESALQRLITYSKTLLSGNSSGMRQANARRRDVQLASPMPDRSAMRLFICARFVSSE